MKRVITFLLILVALAAVLFDVAARPVQTFGMDEGLSSDNVTSITTDSRGYQWIATEEGLNRYDGNAFITFTKENSGLTANELNCVMPDPADPDRLWIATQRNGLCVYDAATGKIEAVEDIFLNSPNIVGLLPARDERGFWIIHYHQGVQYINPATGESHVLSQIGYDGVGRRNWSMAEGERNTIYIGHVNAGFSEVDTLAHTWRNYTVDDGLPGNQVYVITPDRSGNLWLGTDGGAALFNTVTREIIPFVHTKGIPGTIGMGEVHDIKVMQNGDVWFATSRGGLSILPAPSYTASDMSSARFVTPASRGIDVDTEWNNLRCIHIDDYGNAWLGSYMEGVSVAGHIEPAVTRINYTAADGRYLPVWSCTTSPDSRMWLGGNNHIACVDGKGRVTTFPLPDVGELKSQVSALTADSLGRLWIGTDNRGLFIYDPVSRRFTGPQRIWGETRTFLELPDGRMLVGTNRGLYVSDSRSVTSVDTLTRLLPDNVIQSLAFDRQGKLWVGTFGKGLSVIDRDMKVVATHLLETGFPSNAIMHLFVDSRGRMWVATRAGIILFDDTDDPESYRTVCNNITAVAGHISAINESGNGTIYASATRGIISIDPTRLTAELFSGIGGLPVNSFTPRATATAPDGSTCFASPRGIFCIAPGGFSLEPAELPVHITSFNVAGRGYVNLPDTVAPWADTRGKVTLASRDNTFTISFDTPDYSLREYAEYSFMLEGLDKNWQFNPPGNEVTYRDVPAGTYRFVVRSRLKGKTWSEPATLLTIRVEPVFWLTWWARCLYVIVIVALIVLVVTRYKRRIDLRQSLEAEKKNNLERQALNEERLRFYTNITHELRTPLTLIMGPIEDMAGDPSLPEKFAAKMRVIHESSTQLLHLINGILEFRKTETQNRRLSVTRGNLANTLREVGLRYKELNRNPRVQVVLRIDDNTTPIYFDREIITIIVNNFMSNAMKFTRQGTITLGYRIVETPPHGPMASISVSDTGAGMTPDTVRHIFERYYRADNSSGVSGTGIGLALVRNLVELHHGTIDVKSVLGEGSVFTVNIPAGEVYTEAEHASATEHTGDTQTATEVDNDHSAEKERLTILVVEDNDDIREYISQVLSDRYRVVKASNGYEGLQRVNSEMPDIVVSDIMMPELDGIDMCRSIKENMLTSHIPVILLTARDTIDDKQQGYESGADSYLTKPFTATLLLSRIDNIMRQRHMLAAGLMATPGVCNETDAPGTVDKDLERAIASINPLDREFIDKLEQLIDSNLELEDLGVAFLAERMCMSQSTLYRKIMAMTGVSTNEFIRHRRMLRAAELLRRGDTVAEAAYATGFGNHSSFGKAFKKTFGCTPSDYKNNYNAYLTNL